MTNNVIDIFTRKPFENVHVEDKYFIGRWLDFWKEYAILNGCEVVAIIGVQNDETVFADFTGIDEKKLSRLLRNTDLLKNIVKEYLDGEC